MRAKDCSTQLHYGDYLIGMNMTTDQTFELQLPVGVGSAKELVAGKRVKLDALLQVAPRSTLVLSFRGQLN